MADKGYISTNDYYYNNNKIKLLTYKKRNQVQNEEEIENELKERIYVENKAQIGNFTNFLFGHYG
jgi:hypothetical protein